MVATIQVPLPLGATALTQVCCGRGLAALLPRFLPGSTVQGAAWQLGVCPGMERDSLWAGLIGRLDQERQGDHSPSSSGSGWPEVFRANRTWPRWWASWAIMWIR